MDLLTALGTTQKLWDALLKLVHAYRADQERLFDVHVEPIQELVRTVYRDYVDAFTSAAKLLRDPKTNANEILDLLRLRRAAYSVERAEAPALARAIDEGERMYVSDLKWALVREYTSAVRRLLTAGEDGSGPSWYTDYIAKLESHARRLQQVGSSHEGFSNDPRLDLVEDLTLTVDVLLPRALAEVAAAYATLKQQLK